MSNPTLYYWPIKARNYHLQAVAQAGGINLTLKSDFDFAELKSELPFGQVPYLVDGDIKLAQSNAIFRYLSKKGNQQGDSDAAFAASEQFTEEANDLYNLLAKAYYVADRTAGLNELFAPDGGV
jgi:glutathione S-transferase